MMFIHGMTVDYGDQKMLFHDDRIQLELGDEIKAVKKQQQIINREQNIVKLLYKTFKLKTLVDGF